MVLWGSPNQETCLGRASKPSTRPPGDSGPQSLCFLAERGGVQKAGKLQEITGNYRKLQAGAKDGAYRAGQSWEPHPNWPRSVPGRVEFGRLEQSRVRNNFRTGASLAFGQDFSHPGARSRTYEVPGLTRTRKVVPVPSSTFFPGAERRVLV